MSETYPPCVRCTRRAWLGVMPHSRKMLSQANNPGLET